MMNKINSLEDVDKRTASSIESPDDDDKELVALGYKPSFKREFSNLATVGISEFSWLVTILILAKISFAFSIMVGIFSMR
jgi:hypothetical protein